MNSTVRSELSKKNPYYINKHRYYELKHFCLQYPIWKSARAGLTGLSEKPEGIVRISKSLRASDPTERIAEARLYFSDRIEMIEKTAMDVDSIIGPYLLIGVTEGLSYEKLNARNKVPCGKDVYYDLYRKFFWLLSKRRQ